MSRYLEMKQKTQQFHAKYPEVWLMFEKFTLQLIKRGFRHYSARGIWHRIRWETAIPRHLDKDERGIKLGDHHTPFYARAFMKKYPQYKGFFRTKRQTSLDN
jgi:hypothetical protein